jgi:hypothetical protein
MANYGLTANIFVMNLRKAIAKIDSLLRRVCLTYIPSDCNKSALTGEICLKINIGEFFTKICLCLSFLIKTEQNNCHYS